MVVTAGAQDVVTVDVSMKEVRRTTVLVHL